MALSKPMAGEALQDLRICPQCGTKSYIRKKICINSKSYFMRQAPNTNLWVRGPINAVSSPKHWDWQSWKKAGYADGVYQAHLQAELDEIEEEEDESGPVYMGTAVITELHQMNSTFSYSFITFVSFFFVLYHYLHLILLYFL